MFTPRFPSRLSLGCTLALFLSLGGCAAGGRTSEVGPAGGEVRVDNVAAVSVPPDAFERPADVTVERTDLPGGGRGAFGESAALYEVRSALPYEYRVTAAGAGRPRDAVDVEVTLPGRWRRSAGRDPAFAESTVRAFARNVWTGPGGRRLVTLEPLVGTFDPRGETVRVAVPPHFFARTGAAAGDTYAAVLRLGLALAATESGVGNPHWTSAAAAEASPTTRPNDAAPHACAVRLGPPLRGDYRATTPFGPQEALEGAAGQFHPGVDFAPDAALGEAGRDVLAMADGTVIAAGEQPSGDDAREGEPAGWGSYVILAHGRRQAAPFTVYGGLAPGSARVRVGVRVTRGEAIGAVASGEGEAEGGGDLHVEYVPGGAAAGAFVKADPAECFAPVLVERLTAGARSSAVLLPPDADTDVQATEARGTAAENGSWIFATEAKAASGGLAYVGRAGGDVVSRVDGGGLRFVIDAAQSADVRAPAKAPTHPQNAAASGSGGGRIRFRTLAASTYRLTVQYEAPEGAGQWRVDTRFEAAATDAGPARPVDDRLKAVPRGGEGAARFEQTFEGRLDPHTVYDFDFLPSAAHGGSAGKAALSARAVLEVRPDASR